MCDKERTEAIERNRATTIARFAAEQKSRSFILSPGVSLSLATAAAAAGPFQCMAAHNGTRK